MTFLAPRPGGGPRGCCRIYMSAVLLAALNPIAFSQETTPPPSQETAPPPAQEATPPPPPPPKPPAAPALVIQGGTIHLGNGQTLEGGVVIIENGKISAVGADVAVPEGATIIDAATRHVFPGLIDCGARLCVDPSTLTEGSALIQANVVDALEFFDVEQEQEALSQGITSIYVGGLGRGNLNGFGAFLKLRPGATAAEKVIHKDSMVHVLLGRPDATAHEKLRAQAAFSGQLQAARKYIESFDDYNEKLEEYKKALQKLLEEIEKDPSKAKVPKTEGGKPEPEAKPAETPAPPAEGEGEGRRRRPRRPPGNVWEEILGVEARVLALEEPAKPAAEGEKKEEKKEEAPKKPQPPQRTPAMEAWRQVLEGKVTLCVTANTAADVQNLLDLRSEYRFRLVLFGGTQGEALATELKEAGIPLIFTVQPGTKEVGNAVRLHNEGVSTVLATAGQSPLESRTLPLCVASVIAEGMDASAALSAVTSRAAKVLGVDARVGSLSVGKDADVVIADAPPFATSTRVLQVLIEGRTVYQRQ